VDRLSRSGTSRDNMRAVTKTKAARVAPAASPTHPDFSNDTVRSTSAQVAQLLCAARCLSLTPLFVADHPLTVELFDRYGRHFGTWRWRR